MEGYFLGGPAFYADEVRRINRLTLAFALPLHKKDDQINSKTISALVPPPKLPKTIPNAFW